MKRKLLLMMASLLLAGAVSAQTTNFWGNDPDSHAQPSNTPIVASVQIDGNAVTATDAMRLGAFVGNDLRGIAAPHTDGNFWIQVFYTAQTDNISFKFYNGTTEYTTCATTLAGNDAGYGTPNAPQVLNFTTAPATITQTTQLASGWNWWSTPIEIANGSEALTEMENSLGSSCIRIQAKSGYVDYIEFEGMSFWDGNLSSITNEQMYKIRTNAASSFTMSGNPANMSDHTITISNGWNWIGFPRTSSMSLDNAMSAFTPEPEDVIKGKNGYAQYVVFEDMTFWDGNLTTLQPGQGYMYKSNSNATKYLTYPQPRGNDFVETDNKDAVNPSLLSISDNYANNMTITAIVEIDGNILRSEDYDLAAFVGDECRGSVKLKYIKPLDRYVAFLLVHGDREGNLRFVLSDGIECSWSSDYLMYVNDATLGSPVSPVVLHFGPLGIDDNGLATINVYPNPSYDIFNIVGEGIRKVDVINTFGQVIYSKEGVGDFLKIDLGNYSIGAYLVRVITDKGVALQQIIKK